MLRGRPQQGQQALTGVEHQACYLVRPESSDKATGAD
jgi:hypothetical protein